MKRSSIVISALFFLTGVLLGGAAVGFRKGNLPGTNAESETQLKEKQKRVSQPLAKAPPRPPEAPRDVRSEFMQLARFNTYSHTRMITTMASLSTAEILEVLRQPGTLEREPLFHHVQSLLLAELVRRSPEQAVDYVQSCKGPRRDGLLHSLLGAWAEVDPLGATQYLKTLPSNKQQRFAAIVLQHLAAVDGPAALALVRETKMQQHGLDLVFQSWAMHDPAGAARALWERDPNVTSGSWQNVLHNWMRLDPAAAQAFVEDLPAGSGKQSAQQGIYTQLAETNPGEALKLSLANLKGGHKLGTTQQIVSSWAHNDLAAARAAVEAIPDKRLRNRLFSSIFEVWSRNDLPAASEYVASQAPPELRRALTYSVAAVWVEEDPKGAVEWLKKLPNVTARNEAAQLVIHSLSAVDPGEARALAEMLPPGAARNGAYAAIAQGLAREGLEDALDFIKTLPAGSARNHALAGLAHAETVQRDPRKALSLVESLPPGIDRKNFLGQIANNWVHREPEEVFEWAGKLPNKAERDLVMNSITHVVAEHDPKRMAEYYSRAPGSGNNSHLGTIMRQWANNDIDAARAFLHEQPEGENRSFMAAQLLGGWASQDPLGAAREAATLPPGPAQDQAALEVIGEWANQDPAGAAAWVAQFPENEAKFSAVNSLVGRWAHTDPESATAWTKALPAGEARDAAAGAISGALYEDAPAAIAAAELISQAETRESTIESATQRWLQLDREAALAWIQTANISDPTRERLLQQAEKPPTSYSPPTVGFE